MLRRPQRLHSYLVHMARGITSLMDSIDPFVARMMLSLKRERPGLLAVAFHGLFQSHEDVYSSATVPSFGTTVQNLSSFIEYFYQSGYKFISPDEILTGLDPSGYYVFLTFDDGYFNNFNALPVLEKYDVPAVFFIPTGHVRTGKAFWWDVVHRRCEDLGYASQEVPHVCSRLQEMRNPEIESFLIKRLGPGALSTVGDLDRPMNQEELARLARDPHVYMGNHSDGHAALPNCTESEIAEQIATCQAELERMTGKTATVLSYPHGLYSPTVIRIAARIGLHLGVTSLRGKTGLPLRKADHMLLKRNTLWESRDQLAQYQRFRSDVGLYRAWTAIRHTVQMHPLGTE